MIKHTPELLPCPSCGFDDNKYAKHNRLCTMGAGPKDSYMPIIYKSRFLATWVVECQNCGFEAIFREATEEENAKAWNDLCRDQRRKLAAYEEMREACKTLLGIIRQSDGIVGWHLNGDVARWDTEFAEEVLVAEAAITGERNETTDTRRDTE